MGSEMCIRDRFGVVVPIVSYEHMLWADATIGIERNAQSRTPQILLSLRKCKIFFVTGWLSMFVCLGEVE